MPTSDGINLTTTAEMDDVYINYILELDMNNSIFLIIKVVFQS